MSFFFLGGLVGIPAKNASFSADFFEGLFAIWRNLLPLRLEADGFLRIRTDAGYHQWPKWDKSSQLMDASLGFSGGLLVFQVLHGF